MAMRGPDPNEGRNDPMDFDHWRLGEAVQDRLAELGAPSDGTAGIAVDLHDLLQAADRIRLELAPAIEQAKDGESARTAIDALSAEFAHIAWHIETARQFLLEAGPKIA